MAEFPRVAKVSEVPSGASKIVVVLGHPAALFNLAGSLHAGSNVCLHRGGPMGAATLDGLIVTCPLHGWEYDVRTGRNVENPMVRLRTYEARVDGDDVLVGA